VNSVLVTEVQGYSARWAAPEVLENGDQNTREADVFAFGMIVIEVGCYITETVATFEGSEVQKSEKATKVSYRF
jgi:hypothetical protein